MKLLVLLCLFSVTFGAPNGREVSSQDGRVMCDSLLQFLEQLRDAMINGDEEKGIPILEPLTMDSVAFTFDVENTFNFDLKASGIHLTGLSDFQVADMSLAGLTLKFDITLPMSVLKTNTYNFKGLIFGAIPIYGDGKAYFEVGDLRFTGSLSLGLSGGNVVGKGLSLKISVGSLKSQTTGMLGGGDIDNVINAILSDLAPQFFNSNSDLVAEKMSGMVIELVNKVLSGMTLTELSKIFCL